MTFSDYLLSLVRTWVPVAVGSALVWAGRRWGIVLPEDLSAQATVLVTALVVALYYAAVRALEMRWPVFGRLLGRAVPPSYAAKAAPPKRKAAPPPKPYGSGVWLDPPGGAS